MSENMQILFMYVIEKALFTHLKQVKGHMNKDKHNTGKQHCCKESRKIVEQGQRL